MAIPVGVVAKETVDEPKSAAAVVIQFDDKTVETVVGTVAGTVVGTADKVPTRNLPQDGTLRRDDHHVVQQDDQLIHGGAIQRHWSPILLPLILQEQQPGHC